MSRKLNLFVMSVLLSGITLAGELLVNGDISSIAAGIPTAWGFSYDKEKLGAIQVAGRNCLEFESDTAAEACARQHSITVVPGEKYRIEMDIEAENFEYKLLWCVLANMGWKKDAGIKLSNGKLTTNGIQTFSEEFVAPESTGSYSAAFYVNGGKGKCRVYRMSMVPLTEAAEKGSHPCLEINRPILAVVAINRMGLPQNLKELPFVVYGVKDADARLVATIDGKALPPVGFKNQKAFLDVSAYSKGVHKADVKVVANGKSVAERSFTFAYAEPLPEVKVKRSGLTDELLVQEMNGRTEFTFVNPRNGWCYIGIGKPGAERMTAMLDGTLELFPEGFYRNETMRDLSRGVHKIKLSAPAEGRIVVRAVPMSFKYAGVNKTNSFPGMCDYSWEWHKRHALGYTASFGAVGDSFLPEMEANKALGISSALRFHVDRAQRCGKAETEKFLRELQASTAVNDPRATIVDMDEYGWNDYGALINFADLADRFQNIHGKKIITSIASRNGPTDPGLHHYILEQVFNVGGSRGVAFFELYFGTDETEEQARKKITTSIESIINGMEDYMPGSTERLFFVFSNMNHPTKYTSALYANVNFKYYLDLEMNLAANSKHCNKLYSIGFWGCHYADEDVNLWTQKLFKHYLAEGRTDMLSSQYGYSYYLPYLANGEFKKGFDGWERTGDISIDTINRFSSKAMHHWASKDESDTVAVMTPGATLKTTAVKLKPGQKYKLEYVTADYENAKKKICIPKRIPISVELGNANVIQKWDCVNDKYWMIEKSGDVPRIHYYVTHFQPNADTMPLTFSCGGKEGDRFTLNFIKIEPLCE